MKVDIINLKFNKTWKTSGHFKPHEIFIQNRNMTIDYDDNFLKLSNENNELLVYGVYSDTIYDKYGNILNSNFPLSEIHVFCNSSLDTYVYVSDTRLDTPNISDCIKLENRDTTKICFNKLINISDKFITIVIDKGV